MSLLKLLLKIVRYIVSFFIVIILRFANLFYPIKFDHSHSGRLGHFVGINSLYLENKRNKISKKNSIEFFIHDKIISNIQIEKMFSKELNFLSHNFYPILKINKLIPGGNKLFVNYRADYLDRRVIFEHRNIYDSNKINAPLLKFQKSDLELCKKQMKGLSLSESDKIIVLNLRDSNYLKELYPHNDFSYKTQNVDINNYLMVVKELINKGYKVIRTGLNHKKKLNLLNNKYIDLYSDGYRTDLLETYIISKCILYIGSFSGGSTPAEFIFKKPSIITNQIPITDIHSWSRNLFVIFKKIFDKKRNKNISLSEYFELLSADFGPELLNATKDSRYKGSSNKNIFSKYNFNDFDIIENSETEIYDVVFEALKKIESNNLEDKIINQENLEFKFKFKENLNKYPLLKKFHKNIEINVGENFIKNNKNFII